MAREDYLADKYTEADKKLIKIFQEEVKKLDLLYFRAINSSDKEKWKQILSKIKEINKVLKANYDEWADVEIPKEYLKGATYIDDTLEWDNSISVVLEADEKEVRSMIKWLWPVHLEAVNALLNTSKNYVKSSLDWMERQAITMLSELEWEKVREELARWTLLWESLTSMEERIKRYFQNNKISWFKDRAGRLWSMDRYVDMLTRTETAIANIQGTINRAIQLWHTKFKVVENSDCCSFCADENWKIVDIAKGTVDLPPFHPNCRWFIVVVLENWEENIYNWENIGINSKEEALKKLEKFKLKKYMIDNEPDIKEAVKFIDDSPYDFDMGRDNAIVVASYTWDMYKVWNTALRKWEIDEFWYYKDLTESLESSIVAYWKKIDNRLYRWTKIPKGVLDNMRETNEFTDKAFLSFSKDVYQAEKFYNAYAWEELDDEVLVMFELDNWNWLDLEDLSLHPREEEVLINRNSKFKVENIFWEEWAFWTVIYKIRLTQL